MKMVTVTKKLFRDGMSKNGGYSRAQYEAIGVAYPLRAGWHKKLIGSQVTDGQVRRFMSLKDAHVSEITEIDASEPPVTICVQWSSDGMNCTAWIDGRAATAITSGHSCEDSAIGCLIRKNAEEFGVSIVKLR